MSVHNIEAIIEDWRLEKITTEQAIGKILLVLKELEARLLEVEKRAQPQASSQTHLRRKSVRPGKL